MAFGQAQKLSLFAFVWTVTTDMLMFWPMRFGVVCFFFGLFRGICSFLGLWALVIFLWDCLERCAHFGLTLHFLRRNASVPEQKYRCSPKSDLLHNCMCAKKKQILSCM